MKSLHSRDILPLGRYPMNAPRSDRRKRDRRSCSLYLQFMNNRTGELIGDLADISRDGFMLESSKPIPLNSEFSFRVDLPLDISNSPFIVLTAISRWNRQDPIDGRLYDTGFEITKINSSDIRALELIIERYGSRSTGQSSGTGYLWRN